MNPKLRYRFDQLEQDRLKLLDELSKIPKEKLDYKPEPGRWSINEVLTHLLTSEFLTTAYLKKKSMGIDQLEDSGITESVKMIILKISQRIPFLKFKAPKILAQNTPQAFPLPELINRWNLSRLDLKNFLESIPDKNLHKMIYKHPVAGRFDVIQCISFLREHFHHHLPQIKRLL